MYQKLEWTAENTLVKKAGIIEQAVEPKKLEDFIHFVKSNCEENPSEFELARASFSNGVHYKTKTGLIYLDDDSFSYILPPQQVQMTDREGYTFPMITPPLYLRSRVLRHDFPKIVYSDMDFLWLQPSQDNPERYHLQQPPFTNFFNIDIEAESSVVKTVNGKIQLDELNRFSSHSCWGTIPVSDSQKRLDQIPNLIRTFFTGQANEDLPVYQMGHLTENVFRNELGILEPEDDYFQECYSDADQTPENAYQELLKIPENELTTANALLGLLLWLRQAPTDERLDIELMTQIRRINNDRPDTTHRTYQSIAVMALYKIASKRIQASLEAEQMEIASQFWHWFYHITKAQTIAEDVYFE